MEAFAAWWQERFGVLTKRAVAGEWGEVFAIVVMTFALLILAVILAYVMRNARKKRQLKRAAEYREETRALEGFIGAESFHPELDFTKQKM